MQGSVAAMTDPVWEQRYLAGHEERYPWDIVVSFVFNNAPAGRDRAEVSILEVGCGTGSNLRFAAAEGFRVSGIDGSPRAIETARQRFAEDGLSADLQVAEFNSLPFEDQQFDLVIDRAALTCCGMDDLAIALREVARCLKPGGRFLFNPYADSHSSAQSAIQQVDGLAHGITAGSLVGVGPICFLSLQEIRRLLPTSLRPAAIVRKELTDMTGPAADIHSEWIVTIEKVSE